MSTKIIILLLIVIGYTHAIYECSDNSQCLGGSVCKNNMCRCPTGEILNKYGNKCLPLGVGLGAACEEDGQCAAIVGPYKCRQSACACADGHVVLKGRCIRLRLMNEVCDSDDDCFDGVDIHARMCKGGKCMCNGNAALPWSYYERDGFDCRKKAASQQSCSFDSDCHPSGLCKNGKCDEKSTTEEVVFNTELNTSLDISRAVEVFSSCTSNAECKADNSECSLFLGKCRCKLGYFQKNNVCHRELGMSCTGNSDCKPVGSTCVLNKCTCVDKIISSFNQKCLKAPFAPEFKCSTLDSCKIFGSNYQCVVEGKKKLCECDISYELNESMHCVKSKEILRCKKNVDCKRVINSICGPMGVCVCDDKYYLNDDASICVPSANCDRGEICTDAIDNSVCSTKCVCDNGFVAKGNATCIKVAEGIGGPCAEDLECSGRLSDSICTAGSCECAEGFVEVNGGCLKLAKKIGNTCTNHAVCTGIGEHGYCRNGKCICQNKYEPNEDKSGCVMKSGGLQLLGSLFVVFGICLVQLWVF